MRSVVVLRSCALSNAHIRRGGTKIGRIRLRRTSTETNAKGTPVNPTPNSLIQLKSFSIGTVAGFAGSLAGMGGGFIMIPMMTSASMLSLTQHVAHGTSLFAVTTTGLAGGERERVEIHSSFNFLTVFHKLIQTLTFKLTKTYRCILFFIGKC